MVGFDGVVIIQKHQPFAIGLLQAKIGGGSPPDPDGASVVSQVLDAADGIVCKHLTDIFSAVINDHQFNLAIGLACHRGNRRTERLWPVFRADDNGHHWHGDEQAFHVEWVGLYSQQHGL